MAEKKTHNPGRHCDHLVRTESRDEQAHRSHGEHDSVEIAAGLGYTLDYDVARDVVVPLEFQTGLPNEGQIDERWMIEHDMKQALFIIYCLCF